MNKLSTIFTSATLALAAATLFATAAASAPLGTTWNLMRGDQMAPVEEQTEQGYEAPAQFRRQVVAYHGSESPGTIIIDTPNTFLYLVMGNGRAMRYGIGVGRDGFRWSGVQSISKKAEWPDWTPPAEMIARQPYLPRFMAGGPTNPLGARAMYLGNTIYRIHGTNAPSTIGTRVSSGCIRLTNEDVADLYSRVNIGTKVIVINSDQRATAPAQERPFISAPVSLRSNGIY
jgi:lipoprotein-anchoring transpeptidase ErfK/SrfK